MSPLPFRVYSPVLFCSSRLPAFAHHVSSVFLVLFPVSIVCAFLFSVLVLPQPAFWPAFIICISASLSKALFLVFHHLPFLVFACGSSLPEQTDRVVYLNTLPDSLILYLTEIFRWVRIYVPPEHGSEALSVLPIDKSVSFSPALFSA